MNIGVPVMESQKMRRHREKEAERKKEQSQIPENWERQHMKMKITLSQMSI